MVTRISLQRIIAEIWPFTGVLEVVVVKFFGVARQGLRAAMLLKGTCS